MTSLSDQLGDPPPRDKETGRHEALLKVARMLSTATNTDEFLDHILETSRDVLRSEVCSVLLPVNSVGDLRIRSTFEHPDAKSFIIPAGKGISGEVFNTRKSILIRDASRDDRFYQQVSAVSGIDVRAMLTIPLLDGERCLGVLQTINPRDGGFYTDDDVELLETFGSLCAVTLLRLEAQQASIREAQRQEQMGMAREIQQSFLPSAESRFDTLELQAFYEPASSIGGDFFFWHQLDDQKLLFGIGDVTGKGFPAALDMARGSTLIASLAWRITELGLGEWIALVNQGLCDVMTAGRFIGINAILVDRVARKVQVCIAGLPAPKICPAAGWVDVTAPPNPPMGIASTVQFRHLDLPLAISRHWLIISDGILELSRKNGEFFEDAAYAQALEKAAGQDSASGVIGILQSDWEQFGEGDPDYRDDATAIVLTDHAEPPPRRFSFTCCPETINEGRAFIERWTSWCGFDEKDRGLIALGCDEIMNNIVRHAYPCDDSNTLGGSGPASLEVEATQEGMHMRIEHAGEGISDEDFADLTREPDHEKRVGGLGLFVVNQVFDSVHFQKGDPGAGKRAAIDLLRGWQPADPV